MRPQVRTHPCAADGGTLAVQVATVLSNHPNMGGKSFCDALALPRNEHGEPAEHVRLAIGSSDGTVRILNGFNPESVHAAFATKTGSAISTMAVVPIHNRDALFAGASRASHTRPRATRHRSVGPWSSH